MNAFLRTLLIICCAVLSASRCIAAEWKAGAAKAVITPDEMMWMSGYGSRDHICEGKQHDLYAKALALQDPTGQRAVLVTLDLVGIDGDLETRIASMLDEQHLVSRESLAINCSHTHCGPVVGRNLKPMYLFGDDEWQRVQRYTSALENKIVGVVGEAIKNLEPAKLSYGTSFAGFATNRRENVQAEAAQLRAAGKLRGPSDHDVPVLAVRRASDGSLLAITFGYACHATTLQYYQWCGDYPGFAHQELDQRHDGAVALFWAGCGADQNPLPRGTLAHAREYGSRLANAVDEVLATSMRPIEGELVAKFHDVDLPLDKLPSRSELEAQTKSTNKFEASRAKLLLDQIDDGEPLAQTYPYPVQVWRLGPDLRWVFLGGEVVVDFALRIKNQWPAESTWVAGYSNDVMAYIPSRRVLNEGGYEGATAMIYYGLPTRWAPTVEEQIIAEVQRLGQ